MIKKYFVFALMVWNCVACQNPNETLQNANEPILECILDAYIEEFSMRLGKEISIFETKGWSDTTSNVSIRTISSDRLKSGQYWVSKYKQLKIYLSQGRLLENGDLQLVFDKEKIVSNNLTWEAKMIENPIEKEEKIVPPESFDEVQIVYYKNEKCIMETEFMGRNKFKDQLKLWCGFCQSK